MAAPTFPRPDPLIIASDAETQLVRYVQARTLSPLLVCDERTRAAWRLDTVLERAGVRFDILVLPGEPVANELYVDLVSAALRSNLLVALGSGTITDIVRFAAFRAGLDWVSAPTAPSVDGFVSSVAAMTWGGAKISSPASPPAALFASPDVLAAAPVPLVAAGVGDILGKFTSVADWRLGALLYGEPYSETLAETTLELARTVAGLCPSIGSGNALAVGRLMDALIGSGLVMLEQGDSRPASGTEHHIAHVWEMKLIREHRAPVLHGAKVGVASVYAARMWKFLADATPAQGIQWVRHATVPEPSRDETRIRAGFGTAAGSVMESRRQFHHYSATEFASLMDAVAARWEDVRTIARQVPSAEAMEGWLRACGGPTTPAELGLADDLDEALELGPYLRDRFTAARLLTLLGIDLKSFR